MPWVAVPVGLSFVTYTVTGYQYQVWPQLFLQYLVRYSGKLSGDWATAYPDPHWTFTHLLSLVPSSALSTVVFLLWAAGLVGLWLAFASLCRALGVTWSGVIGAGLLAASTGFAGLGISRPVTGFLYPTNLAFALVVAALAALFHGRSALAGAFLGLATLIHPQVGLLAALAIIPGAAYYFGLRRWRRLVVLLTAFLVPTTFAVYMVLTQQVLGSNLSSHQQYELLAIVRVPWHFLYRAFTTAEYAEVVSWAVVLAVALPLLRARRFRGALAVMFGACVAVCSLGALASQIGWPLILVEIQTARLSSLAVLLGIVVMAATLSQFVGAWTGPTLMLVALLTPLIRDGLLTFHHLPRTISGLVNTSSVAAWAALVLVLGLAWATKKGSTIAPAANVPRRIVRFAFACTLAVMVVSLIGPYQTARAQTRSQAERDWIAIAERAKQVSKPTDQVLAPPDQDLFPLFSDRPVVITFGSLQPSGVGASEWIRRMIAVTGNPRVVDPSLTTNVTDRLRLIVTSYDRTVAHSAAPICRYDVKLVVVSSTVMPPRWLSLVEKTPTYALYKVSRPPCSSPKATAR
ncbi:MAG: DUF6798 domain-containing protein [Gaiellaceae bacterium]